MCWVKDLPGRFPGHVASDHPTSKIAEVSNGTNSPGPAPWADLRPNLAAAAKYNHRDAASTAWPRGEAWGYQTI